MRQSGIVAQDVEQVASFCDNGNEASSFRKVGGAGDF